jgi:hypothetical protein
MQENPRDVTYFGTKVAATKLLWKTCTRRELKFSKQHYLAIFEILFQRLLKHVKYEQAPTAQQQNRTS